MTQAEARLLKFIDDRLERMLSAPEMWGANESVELQVLQLLELRVVLLTPADAPHRWRQVQRDYVRYLAGVFPEGRPETLSVLLVSSDRANEFQALLARFARQQIRGIDAEARRGVAADLVQPAGAAAREGVDLEAIDRRREHEQGDEHGDEFGSRAVEFPRATTNP